MANGTRALILSVIAGRLPRAIKPTTRSPGRRPNTEQGTRRSGGSGAIDVRLYFMSQNKIVAEIAFDEIKEQSLLLRQMSQLLEVKDQSLRSLQKKLDDANDVICANRWPDTEAKIKRELRAELADADNKIKLFEEFMSLPYARLERTANQLFYEAAYLSKNGITYRFIHPTPQKAIEAALSASKDASIAA